MPEPQGCSSCGMDVNRHGLARHLEWGREDHTFCSYRCEFFWRRMRCTDHDLAGAALRPQLTNTPPFSVARVIRGERTRYPYR
jgi:hypothetical protein